MESRAQLCLLKGASYEFGTESHNVLDADSFTVKKVFLESLYSKSMGMSSIGSVYILPEWHDKIFNLNE